VDVTLRSTPQPPGLWWDAAPSSGGGDRYGLVLLLILTALLLSAAVGARPWGIQLVQLVLAGTLLFTLHTAHAPRHLRRLARLLVGLTVGLSLLTHLVLPGRSADGVATVVMILLVVATPPAIAHSLLRRGVIDAATVLGALCVYLLAGLFFALVFGLTALLGLGPFFASLDDPSPIDYLYFSFVTLTTVGYGDLTARGDLGRMLAVTEALLGQLYLVTVVAVLVGNLVPGRRHQ
jgi:hypothetical protein